MKEIMQPVFSKISITPKKSTIQQSSPFSSVSAAFNWVNKEYPYEHTHSHWEIFLMMSGKIKHIINGKERILTRGDACLIRPKDSHKLCLVDKKSATDYQSITFTFSVSLGHRLLSLFSSYDDLQTITSALHFSVENDFLDKLKERLLSAQLQSRDNFERASVLMITDLLVRFFEQQLNSNPIYPDWLNHLLTYLNSPLHFGDSLTTIAKQTPYSYSRLSTLFKQYTGKTIIQYINNLKMIYAKRLLRTTDKTILEISYEVYYDSISSFNHNFKKAFNCTPTEYRKSTTSSIPEPTIPEKK